MDKSICPEEVRKMSLSIRVETAEIDLLLEMLGRTRTGGEGSSYSGVIPSIVDGPGLRYLIIRESKEYGEIEGDQSTLGIVHGWLSEVAELGDMDREVKLLAKNALLRRLELK